MKIKGVIPPFITPLDERERVIEKDVEVLVERLIEAGIENIFLLGTMGEGPLLSDLQKRVLVKRSIKAARGRSRIMVNVSDASSVRAEENIRVAEELGADQVASSLPIYLSLDSQTQIIEFYAGLASTTNLPFLIYDMPRLVNTNISIDTYRILSREKNIVGMKDSSGNFHRFRELVSVFRNCDDFSLFTGDEWTIDASLFVGADGFVPGIGCLVPDLCQELYQAGSKGDIPEAVLIQEKLIRIFKIYGEDARDWDAAMKEALRQAGVFSSAVVAKPMGRVNDTIRERVSKVLRSEGLI